MRTKIDVGCSFVPVAADPTVGAYSAPCFPRWIEEKPASVEKGQKAGIRREDKGQKSRGEDQVQGLKCQGQGL